VSGPSVHETSELLHASGRRTIISTPFYKELRRPRAIASFLWNEIKEELSNADWTVLSSGSCESGRLDFAALAREPSTAGIDGLTEFIQDPAVPIRPYRFGSRPLIPSALAATWKKLCGEVVIPHDLDRRKACFRDAYCTLRPLLEYYEGKNRAK
jgi:hypothetical protein